MNNWFRRLVYLLSGCVPALMFIAAIGKLSSWSEFEQSMRSYSLVNTSLQSYALYIVPAAETATFVFFVTNARITANVACPLLIFIFTSVTWWHWVNNVTPDCACFGLWQQYVAIDKAGRWIFIRNGILSAMSIVSIMLILKYRACDGKTE